MVVEDEFRTQQWFLLCSALRILHNNMQQLAVTGVASDLRILYASVLSGVRVDFNGCVYLQQTDKTHDGPAEFLAVRLHQNQLELVSDEEPRQFLLLLANN